MKKGRVWVGTSGFSYLDWQGKFYPPQLPSRQWLEFYSQHFSSLEINSTFYRLPSEKTFLSWKKRTPKNFVFSVKVNRRITHLKRLKISTSEGDLFFRRVSLLGKKLGVLLFQLPPWLRKDAPSLEGFLRRYHSSLPFAFEFRHPSWFDEEVFGILKDYNCSLVFHDAQAFPRPSFTPIADFVYLRFHGVEVLYNYQYSLPQLKKWAQRIKRWLASGLTVFAFFNNDPGAFAVKNARQTLALIKSDNKE